MPARIHFGQLKAIKRRGPCCANGGSGGAAQPGADFYISEARKAGAGYGLYYLIQVAPMLLKKGEREIAQTCLAEARTLLEADWKPGNFYHAFKIADSYFMLGQEAKAEGLIVRVLADAQKMGNIFERNNLRGAAAMTYLVGGKTGKAREIARGIAEPADRFGCQMNLAEVTGKKGDAASAAEILLADCAAAARLSGDGRGKVTVSARLRLVAEKLINVKQPAEAEKLLDEAAQGLSIYDNIQKDEIENIAIQLARAGKEQKAIDLLIVGCGCINPDAFSERSAQELEDFKVTYLPHMWDKFFLANVDSLLPRMRDAFERNMNRWKEKGVNPSEAVRVDLPILMGLMKKMPRAALDVYDCLLEPLAVEGMDPAYTLHALLPALEKLQGIGVTADRYEAWELYKNLRDIAGFIKKALGDGIDPREALWHEIPYLIGVCGEVPVRFFDVFLGFQYLYLSTAKNKFVLKTSLREVLPQLPKADIVKWISKMRGLADEKKDPATVLRALSS